MKERIVQSQRESAKSVKFDVSVTEAQDSLTARQYSLLVLSVFNARDCYNILSRVFREHTLGPLTTVRTAPLLKDGTRILEHLARLKERYCHERTKRR